MALERAVRERAVRKRTVRKRAEYQRIQQFGRRLSTANFTFLLLRRADSEVPPDGPRLGIIASRRLGNAVVRNRAKRLVREAFRHTEHLFGADFDVVVAVRRCPRQLKLANVLAEWQGARSRIARATAISSESKQNG